MSEHYLNAVAIDKAIAYINTKWWQTFTLFDKMIGLIPYLMTLIQIVHVREIWLTDGMYPAGYGYSWVRCTSSSVWHRQATVTCAIIQQSRYMITASTSLQRREATDSVNLLYE